MAERIKISGFEKWPDASEPEYRDLINNFQYTLLQEDIEISKETLEILGGEQSLPNFLETTTYGFLRARYKDHDESVYNDCLDLVFDAENPWVRIGALKYMPTLMHGWKVNVEGENKSIWHLVDQEAKDSYLSELSDDLFDIAIDGEKPELRSRAIEAYVHLERLNTNENIGVSYPKRRKQIVTESLFNYIDKETDSRAKGTGIYETWVFLIDRHFVQVDKYSEYLMKLYDITEAFIEDPENTQASLLLISNVLSSKYGGFRGIKNEGSFTFGEMANVVQRAYGLSDESGDKAHATAVLLTLDFFRGKLDIIKTSGDDRAIIERLIQTTFRKQES